MGFSMKDTLFPRKTSVFAIALTLFYLAGNLTLFYKLSEQFEIVYRHHFPIHEMNAINIRLGQSLSSITKNLVFEYNEEDFLEYRLERDSLSFNISSYKQLLKESKKDYLLTNDFGREKLGEFEVRVIALAKLGKTKEARSLFKSKEYENLKNNYFYSSQSIAEHLSTERDSFLKNKVNLFNFGVILSMGFFTLLAFIWLRVIFAYKTNTEVKRKALADLELERAKSSHNAKMASLGEMAAGLAHEINNPLTIINGYASQLGRMVDRGKLDSEKLTHISTKLSFTCKRIATIIKGLKTFSRDSEGEDVSDVTVIDVIEDTLSFCQEKFKNHGINFEINHLPHDIYISVRPVEISQVILNLLNNAFDAVEELDMEDKWLKIEIEDLDHLVKISIIDCGPGISEELAHKILEPFFTTKEIGKGTGLGLSISKNIIEKHEGLFSIDIKSPNTKFDIILPKTDTPVVKNEEAA
ncbi:hypothetical protein A9Q84_13295 [Halobacteriovorax marinus]|uniref:histidine kinase n=1 Tax=Halobacteriovorax marinus TaxID=97084 RepID=A0A1Y5F953_9BACT|nr:hypothetical protein A9Q84_13295 [Halobacteriovorax marinus]